MKKRLLKLHFIEIVSDELMCRLIMVVLYYKPIYMVSPLLVTLRLAIFPQSLETCASCNKLKYYGASVKYAMRCIVKLATYVLTTPPFGDYSN